MSSSAHPQNESEADNTYISWIYTYYASIFGSYFCLSRTFLSSMSCFHLSGQISWCVINASSGAWMFPEITALDTSGFFKLIYTERRRSIYNVMKKGLDHFFTILFLVACWIVQVNMPFSILDAMDPAPPCSCPQHTDYMVRRHAAP